MNCHRNVIVFARLALLSFMLTACGPPIAQSHIEGNVPDSEDFDALLEVALRQHLDFPTQVIEFDLLRRGPTQSGVSYPKYYVWVRVTDESGVISEGAARIAAINKSRFDVTDYIGTQELASNPPSIESVFPVALHESIRKRAGIVVVQ